MEDGADPNAQLRTANASENDETIGDCIVSSSLSSDLTEAGSLEADTSVQPGQQHYVATQGPHDRQHSTVPTALGHLDMASVAAALPTYGYSQMPQPIYPQQYSHQVRNPQIQYPFAGTQYPGAMTNNYPVPFNPQGHSQNFQPPRLYAPYQVNASMGGGQHMFHNQPFFPQQPALSPPVQGSFQSGSQAQWFGQEPGLNYTAHVTGQYRSSQIHAENFGSVPMGTQAHLPGDNRKNSATTLKIPSTLRGPPRKPKQSGHALWVGNLPPGTNIMDLKDHFAREATEDIESVFLISKSNCAFVNYKSEQSCAAAMSRFHDSRFNGVRLVCRLRRGSSPTTATLPAGLNIGTGPDLKSETVITGAQGTTQMETAKEETGESIKTQERLKERYFIIKSLTIEDLERSVLSGIWATQSHNEESLNQAYQTAENVYLIFSANKSGEYFGYARMDSAIDSESAASIDLPPAETQTLQTKPSVAVAELPLTIPTPATATAPKGYIIDDSARGTIFWEAESSMLQVDPTTGTSPANTDSGNVSGEETVEHSLRSPTIPDSPGANTTYGKPFKITWLSTDRLPFYRTRGLRNPWNTNREVKIARDGTELEPSVGKKLISMFNPGIVSGRFQQQQQQGQYSEMISFIPGQGPAYRPY